MKRFTILILRQPSAATNEKCKSRPGGIKMTGLKNHDIFSVKPGVNLLDVMN